MPRLHAVAFSVFLLGLCPAMRAQSCTATIETVAGQVGGSVVFCGTPDEVHVSAKSGGPVHVNFGGTYPNQVFSVVIFPDVAGDDVQGLVKRLTGKKVQVSGLVKAYKGKPEIVLKAMDDLKVE